MTRGSMSLRNCCHNYLKKIILIINQLNKLNTNFIEFLNCFSDSRSSVPIPNGFFGFPLVLQEPIDSDSTISCSVHANRGNCSQHPIERHFFLVTTERSCSTRIFQWNTSFEELDHIESIKTEINLDMALF